MSSPDRIRIIEPLRGIAAFSVMWFHFTYVNRLFEGTDAAARWLRSSGEYGWLGVEVFFVISGFILPYSMYRRGYTTADFGRFVTKRIVRLDPPYLANIVLALALWYFVSQVPGFQGQRFRFEPLRFLSHLGYLNAIVGYGWYNPVYWTLAIEFQFYLLLACVFPLLVHPTALVRHGFPLLFAALAVAAPQDNLVFHWLGLFAGGMVAFQFFCGLCSQRVFLLLTCLIAALNVVALGALVAAVGAASCLVIVFARIPRIPALEFLGTISYSLYLVHVPVGSRFINLGQRFAETLPERLVVLFTSLVISIWFAYLMYRWFERPAQRWSSAMEYRRGPPPAAAVRDASPRTAARGVREAEKDRPRTAAARDGGAAAPDR